MRVMLLKCQPFSEKFPGTGSLREETIFPRRALARHPNGPDKGWVELEMKLDAFSG